METNTVLGQKSALDQEKENEDIAETAGSNIEL
jgi:hypothetical protein